MFSFLLIPLDYCGSCLPLYLFLSFDQCKWYDYDISYTRRTILNAYT